MSLPTQYIQLVIGPVGPVENRKTGSSGSEVRDCLHPIGKCKSRGRDCVSGEVRCQGARQRHHSRHEVARGVGAAHVVNGFPVYWYVVGTA